jgi:phosphoglucosamine mutase
MGSVVGRVSDEPDAGGRYAEHLAATVSSSLSGLRIVIDCAQGAASLTAPRVFAELGADVVSIHDQPDGLNINDGCGSTDLGSLRRAVVEHGADAGFALDGDADRCLAVDASGEVVDGDQLLAILSLALRDAGQLRDDTVVATVMSNLGFVHAMRDAGVHVVTTAVGDRYVLEEMRSGGYVLGGEQSGHVIMSSYATTGDGVLAALHVAERMALTGSSLSALAGIMHRLPQTMVNVPDVDKGRAHVDETVQAAVQAAEAELGDSGRVLLRPSGTEPLVRVMVEAESADQADALAHRLADVVKAALSL